MKKLYLHILIIILTVDLVAQVSFKTVNRNNDQSFFEELQSFKNLNEDEISLAPDGFELSQNYPNPFNPSTVITFKLPEKSFVSLKVYNVLGNEIVTLINEEKSPGTHSIKFDVSELPRELSNGTYFYMLKAGNFTETKKMIYIK